VVIGHENENGKTKRKHCEAQEVGGNNGAPRNVKFLAQFSCDLTLIKPGKCGLEKAKVSFSKRVGYESVFVCESDTPALTL
jgi:hypothetical protein